MTCEICLAQCALVTPYNDIDLGQSSLGDDLTDGTKPLTNDEFSMVIFCGIHLSVLSQSVHKLLSIIRYLKIIVLKLLPHLPRANQ